MPPLPLAFDMTPQQQQQEIGVSRHSRPCRKDAWVCIKLLPDILQIFVGAQDTSIPHLGTIYLQ